MDESRTIRPGEELSVEPLHTYLTTHLKGYGQILDIRQFPGGYSNLTYLIRTDIGEYVLRRPPLGANIKSAHDMGREFRVLQTLLPVYSRIPTPVLYCEDRTVLGVPFYLMQKVDGLILRNRVPENIDLNPGVMARISTAAIDNLAALHAIDIYAADLDTLGKPTGYVQRQVEGWMRRYTQAETDAVEDMHRLARWMQAHLPPEQSPALLHNDYKYDNLVLDTQDPGQIRAVLDWEMCTTGDPLMDLGVALAYWIQPGEANALLASIGNLTWLPGNLSREQLVERYARHSHRAVEHILFYYVFGTFKIGVIVQQIYARYKQGATNDPRFAGLIEAVRLFGAMGCRALDNKHIAG